MREVSEYLVVAAASVSGRFSYSILKAVVPPISSLTSFDKHTSPAAKVFVSLLHAQTHGSPVLAPGAAYHVILGSKHG